MITEKKIKEIKSLLQNGVPEGEMKLELQEEGFTEEDIKEAFKPKPYDMRSWFLFFGIVVSCFGVYTIMNNHGFLPLILGLSLLWRYYSLDLKLKRGIEQKQKSPHE